jgi:hypothetical protein
VMELSSPYGLNVEPLQEHDVAVIPPCSAGAVVFEELYKGKGRVRPSFCLLPSVRD